MRIGHDGSPVSLMIYVEGVSMEELKRRMPSAMKERRKEHSK